MSASPLQLESYQIDRLSVEAVEEHDGSQSGVLEIAVDPTTLHRKDDPCAHQIVLDVKFRPAEIGSAPYAGRIVGRAFFHVSEELDEQAAQNYVLFNGSAILFGLLRAQVAQVTALGPWGTLLLPSVNLVEMFSAKAGVHPRAKAAAKKSSAVKARKSGTEAARKANAARTAEARSEAARKANVSRGAAGRSAAAKKAAATRAAARAARQEGKT
jgi:preprotein translocase subunit SecB